MTAFQGDSKQMTENDSKKGIDFLSSANANVRAYQAKLLEIAQTNMQFAFEWNGTTAPGLSVNLA